MWAGNHASECCIARTDRRVLGESRAGSGIPGHTVGCRQVSVPAKVLVMLAVRNPSQVGERSSLNKS